MKHFSLDDRLVLIIGEESYLVTIFEIDKDFKEIIRQFDVQLY